MNIIFTIRLGLHEKYIFSLHESRQMNECEKKNVPIFLAERLNVSEFFFRKKKKRKKRDDQATMRSCSFNLGVTGQPGVDFPAFTTIPATSFSCRGLKGGYYADLETNCQVSNE